MKLAIITARGGSKRIPKKNIKMFCGKPIISYSIEAAIASDLFDEVMVSTDNEEIARVAEATGAVVPFYRSEENSNDYATTSDVLLEVLSQYHNKGVYFDYACCIYPTAPFITAKKIKRAMDLLEESDAEVVMSVVSFSYPPQRGLVENSGFLEMREPKYVSTRSQDLPIIYHDAGQFYCFDVKSFLKRRELLIGKVKGYVLPELEVQDIDTEIDWKLAEMKYKLMNEGQKSEKN